MNQSIENCKVAIAVLRDELALAEKYTEREEDRELTRSLKTVLAYLKDSIDE